MNSRFLVFTSLFAAASLLSSCKGQKPLEAQTPLRNRSAQFLSKRLEDNILRYDGLGMKISAEIRNGDDSESFKATLRIKHDSLMWVSISPALGVEVLRMLISRDSVKYVSKIPQNKHYYIGDFSGVTNFLSLEVSLDMLEAILVGNPLAFDPKDDKFRSRTEDRQYVLSSKYRRSVQRVVGVDDKDLNPEQDTLVVNPDDKDYQRLLKKGEEEDLIIKRYWLNADNYRLEKTVFNDLFNNRSLEIIHSEFDNTEEFVFPSKTVLRVEGPTGIQEITFEITRFKPLEELDFPFEIPTDFARKVF
jgi:hypothetical protein